MRVVQGTVGGGVTPKRPVYERALARAIELRALVRELVGSLRGKGALRLHACLWDNGMQKTVDRGGYRQVVDFAFVHST